MSSSASLDPFQKLGVGADTRRASSPLAHADLQGLHDSRDTPSPTPSVYRSRDGTLTDASRGLYRGGPSPSPSLSKRDMLRSKHPQPRHVSKLENIIGKKEGSSKDIGHDDVATTDIGILSDEVYDEYLPAPVAWVRRWLVWSLRKETKFLAWHQPKVRTPFRDRFFVYTSLFGTHSFFLIFLPAAFWISSRYYGRGLVNTLAFGVYLSSAIKDLFCVPRPYSPPVTRLTVGSTHLEYGFPSTHSTNSVGMALYIYLCVCEQRKFQLLSEAASPSLGLQSWFWEVGLVLYTFSVVYGRVYAGMHSIMDCTAGSLLGATITLVQWYGFHVTESFLETEGWIVPALIIPGCLLLVYTHPQPLDDCPCFEDSIAFISVVMGVCLGRWASLRWSLLAELDENPLLMATARKGDAAVGASSGLVYVGCCLLAMVVGILCIFCVRVVAKTTCKLVLPSIFRFVDRTFGLVLPRRHYVPSSEYTEVPMSNIIRSPSFLDIPTSLTPTVSGGPEQQSFVSASSGVNARLGDDLTHRAAASRQPRRDASSTSSSGFLLVGEDISRSSSPASAYSDDSRATGTASPVQGRDNRRQPGDEKHTHFPPVAGSAFSVPITHPTTQGGPELPSDKVARKVAGALSHEERQRQAAQDSGEVKHYDIDVLTKVITYSSIGFFASSLVPALLERTGLAPQ